MYVCVCIKESALRERKKRRRKSKESGSVEEELGTNSDDPTMVSTDKSHETTTPTRLYMHNVIICFLFVFVFAFLII